MNTRKSGFYWVKFDGLWEPASWNEARGVWALCGIDEDVKERNMEAINETPLLPPIE